jgi:hypothetical protein
MEVSNEMDVYQEMQRQGFLPSVGQMEMEKDFRRNTQR